MTFCNLCPRRCAVDRVAGQVGYCGCGDTVKVARAAPHFWEERCISGKNGSGTVFFSGCNLRCAYCQNRTLSSELFGYEVNTERLADIFISLQEQGVHNINLVTPTPYSDKIKLALDIAWEKGLYLPAVYNCGGYESEEAIRSLRGYVGVYMPDFKYFDTSLAASLSGAPDYPDVAKASLREMVKQRGGAVFDSDGMMVKGVIVRHLVLPGHTEDSIDVIDYLHREYGDEIYISIMGQYTPMPWMRGELARPVSADEYNRVVEYAREIGVVNGFIQEQGCEKDSFIPVWDGQGVVK